MDSNHNHQRSEYRFSRAGSKHIHAQLVRARIRGVRRADTMAVATPRRRMTEGNVVCREAGADNRDDVIWDRRHKHRRAGLAGVYKSCDVIQMQILISAGELSHDDAPTPPDPSDRSLSKRQWELSTAKYTPTME